MHGGVVTLYLWGSPRPKIIKVSSRAVSGGRGSKKVQGKNLLTEKNAKITRPGCSRRTCRPAPSRARAPSRRPFSGRSAGPSRRQEDQNSRNGLPQTQGYDEILQPPRRRPPRSSSISLEARGALRAALGSAKPTHKGCPKTSSRRRAHRAAPYESRAHGSCIRAQRGTGQTKRRAP